jgi:hypothetical protein
MQCELLEAAQLLLFNVVHDGGDTSGLKTFRRKLADSKRRISHVQFAALSGMADDVARFEKLKASMGRVNVGTVSPSGLMESPLIFTI